MKEPADKIMDAFLDEAFNDCRPGRSPAEMLREIKLADQEKTDSKAPESTEILPSLEAAREPGFSPETNPSFAESTTRPRTVASPVASQSASPNWMSILSIAGVMLTVAALVVFLLQRDRGNPDDLLVDKEDRAGQKKAGPGQDNRPGDRIVEQRPDNPGRQDSPPDHRPPTVDEPVRQLPDNRIVERRPDVPVDQTALVLPPDFERSSNINVVAQTPGQMADSVNRRLNSIWNSDNLQPAPDLAMRNWVNRLSSRLIGRVPNADELQATNGILAQSKSPGLIRRELVDFFLQSPEFQEEFNNHWGHVLSWKMLGISPTMQATDRDMMGTRELLASRIGEDEPLDKVVFEMLSAVGTTDPERDDYNAASSYLAGLTKRFGDLEFATAHVSNTFQGQRMQCNRCHDSFGESVASGKTQQEFYEFHAFFAQLRFEPVAESEEKQVYVVNRNYLPLGAEGRVEAAVRFIDLQGVEHEVYPRLGDTQLGPNGFVARVDRRSELARLVVASSEFRETMVDHIWTSMLNLPLSGIDGRLDSDLAELRTELGDQFAANDFDLKWLVNTIASSNAFAVGVGSDEQLAASNPFLGEPPAFNIFYSRLENRRSAIQSLGIVAQAYTSGNVEQALSAGLLARVKDTVEVQPRTILPFVPNKDSEWATSPLISSQLDLISASDMSAEEKIKHVILAALGRTAHPQEIEQALIILENSENHRIALQDVWWSLLNSVEYHIPLSVR